MFNQEIRLCGGIALLFQLTFPVSVQGHHSPVTRYNVDETIEIEGVVESVSWRNPHSTFRVNVTDESGGSVIWSVESGGLMELRLRGLDRGVIAPGDRIRVAGLQSRRGRSEMFGRNVLLEDGREVLFDVAAKPRFSDTQLEYEADERLIARARQEADGIFRVWSSLPDDPTTHPRSVDGSETLPLTESARAAVASWDPATAPSVTSCEKAMPTIMLAPLIMRFARDGNNILLNIEEFDTRRVIHMTEKAPPADEPYSLLGYSVGRWEGDRLHVETSRVEATAFADGVPLSRQMLIQETFEPLESGDRMSVTLAIADPESFTTSYRLSWGLAWNPGLEVADYNCEHVQE